MRKRYLFFDIDGTLLAGGYENSYIPDSTREAIRRLRESGHFLAIATGRSHAMAQETLRTLGFENMVSDGGYGLTVGGKLLGIRPLDKEKVVALVRECEEKGFAWALQTDDSDTRVAPDGRFAVESEDQYLKSRVVPGLRPETQEAVYKMYVACRAPQEQTLETLKALPWMRYFPGYLFIEPMDKAVGIRAMLDHFGADYADAVVFGDGENDLSMFTDVWTKVAMGNAHEALKAKADLITADVDKDGIFLACRSLGLI